MKGKSIIFLILIFLISNCLAAEIISVEPKILSSIRNPVSFSGKIVISYNKTISDKIQLKSLKIVSGQTILKKNLSKSSSFEYGSNVYFIEGVRIDPKLIFKDFKPGISKNLIITVSYDYLNKSYVYSLKFPIKILEPLPKMKTEVKSVDGMMALLPSQANLYYGDLHIHTGYSSWNGYDGSILTISDNCPKESQNLAGLTVEEMKSQANALGLNWFVITDHSYCLDDFEWQNLRFECNRYKDASFMCIVGEEMSVAEEVEDFEALCDNNKKDSMHLGISGMGSFIQQYPANVWCPVSPSARELIGIMNGIGGISIVNHPYTLLEIWDSESFDKEAIDGETGVEIWNGEWDSYDEMAHNKWIQLLLRGKKIFAYGGTDTHDDVTDVVYNGIYLDNFDSSSLLRDLRSGNSFVSNNGALNFLITTNSNSANFGDTISAKKGAAVKFKIEYNLIGSCRLILYKGVIGNSKETVVKDWGVVGGASSRTFDSSIEGNNLYYRVECIGGDGLNRIYGNPIWINSCQDECTAGNTRCIDSKTMQKCGDYDADVCSEWGDDLICAYGCVGSACFEPPQSLPDLTVNYFVVQYPSSPKINKDVTLAFRIKNIGEQDAYGVYWKVYTGEGTNYKVNNAGLNIKAGSSVMVYTKVRYTKAGIFTARVVADYGNNIEEALENNNEKTLLVAVGS